MNKKLVGSAVLGAAVLAIVAAQLTGRTDTAPAAAPPQPQPAPVVTQGALEVYRLADAPGGPGAALEIPVPANWAVTRDGERASYRRGELLLETDRAPITQEDVLSGLRAVAGGAGGTVVEHAPVAGRDAAEWDFGYERGGVARRVAVVGVGAGDALVTIRFEAPAAEFERDRGVFDEALRVRG